MNTLHVFLGKDLSAAELEVINAYRKSEFGSVSVVAPQVGNADWDKPYFLVKDQGRLAAFGRLHDTIAVDFRGEQYQILGIASVVAVVKGRGYGRELMIGMKQYIHQPGLTAVGFCAPEVSSFYAKCGYQILAGGVSRFRFIGEEGRELPPDHGDDDVLYFDDGGLMASVLRHSDDWVVAHRAAW